MKKWLKCILMFTIFVILSAFGMKVYAADEEEIYLITEEGGEYSLYSSDSEKALLKVSDKLSEILCETKGGKAVLDGISVNEPVYLSDGDYTLCGEAFFSSVLEIQPTSALVLESAKFDFFGEFAHIRIKGGNLTVRESIISSDTREAILSDYSSASKLILESGQIRSEMNAAIKISEGSAVILDGDIVSDSAEAIHNRATLSIAGNTQICGYGYDVVTELPINLSYNGNYFSSELRVCFLEHFQKGTQTEIFRSCSEESIAGCRVFDVGGVEFFPKYFEESKHVSEKRFAAVYLPYTVRLFDNGGLIDTIDFLRGETLGNVEAPEKFGYEFSAWYKDEKKTEKISASEKIKEDLDIHASYSLKKMNFVLLSVSFTYDGEERFLNFSELSHPLADKGRFGFEWYKDGEYIGNYERGVPVRNVSDSGNYSCRVTFYYEKDSVSVTSPSVHVGIEKQTVKIPEIPAVKYNGSCQYSGCKSSELFTVTENGGIDAGVYKVKLNLRDSENYCFENDESDEAFAEFRIEKTENYWTSPLIVKNTYLSFRPQPLAYAAFGEVSFFYYTSLDFSAIQAPGEAVGDYYVVARVAETDNYSSLESEPVRFSVLEECVASLSVISMPSKVEYCAFEKFVPDGLQLKALYNSGRDAIVTGSEITVNYQEADDFRFGDTAVNVDFSGVVISIPVSIKKAVYDLSNITFTDTECVYDGEYHTISYKGSLPVGKDGHQLRASASAGGVDAGVYKICLSFDSESKNYAIPKEINATLTILQRSVDVVWSETDFLYDGTSKKPSASFVDVNGREISLEVFGAVDFAVDSAEAYVTPPSDNYVFPNPRTAFTVRKADYKFDSVEWTFDNAVYDGERKTVTVRNLPSGVEVIGYTDNSAVNAGKYKTTAILKYDERNYNPPQELVFEWEILPAEYDMSSFSVKNTVCVYDGNIHYPTVMGNMPTGYDGIALEYSFSGGAVHVSEGECEIEIKFSTQSKNYLTPKSIYTTVEITPMPIYVEWSYEPSVFNGEMHAPMAVSEHCDVTVIGGTSLAGVHVAEAKAASTDYSIVNNQFEFLISKAENRWVITPSMENLFEGDDPQPKGEALEGEVKFSYYEDEDCTREVFFPLASGKYYMKACVEASENYLYLESEPIAFEVVEVFATGFDFTLIGGGVFTAFSRLSDSDFEAYALYNNGKKTPISLDGINVSYPNGDSFRCIDKYIVAEWNGFSVQAPVVVNRAVYNLSEVLWDGTEQEYDGLMKVPTLLGLPEGVKVLEYLGGGVKCGEYEVYANLEFDNDNYEEPKIGPCVLKIVKQSVEIPTLPSVIYNGQNLAPISSSALYRFEVSSFINAGEYVVRVVLNDTENYTFNSADSVIIPFRIEKKNIEISVRDIELYKYEEPYFPSYSSSLSQREIDSLGIYFVTDGDYIYLKTDDPNHEIICKPGKIIRHNRLSPEKITLITALSILVFLFLLGALLILIYRRKILHVYAAMRCRRAFARGMVTDPVPFPLTKEIPQAKEPCKNMSERDAEGADMELCDDDISLKALSAEEELVISVDVEHADSLITDSLAKNLIRNERETVFTDGWAKNVVNVDTLSQSFNAGDRVDINTLKEHRLIARDTAYVKVLARGSIDKALSVHANAFSLSAVKMIALTGGEAIKVNTSHKREEKKKAFYSKDY